MPFTLVPGAAAGRASIFFIILIFIFTYCISFLVFEISIIKIKKKYLKVSSLLIFIPFLFFIILSSYIIVLISNDLYVGIDIKSQMNKRHEYLLDSSKNSEYKYIVLKTIKGEKPKYLNFAEISVDENYWVNEAIAEAYKIDHVCGGYEEVSTVIENIYVKFLDRNPDINEIKKWSYWLEHRERSCEDLVIEIIKSEEFKNRNLTDTQFIDILYEGLLQRKQDGVGFEWWINRLENDKSKIELLDEFTKSKEFEIFCDKHHIKSIND